MENRTPFYFADYIWKNEKGHTTYGMLLVKRPDMDNEYDLHILLKEAYTQNKKIAITMVYDNREQSLDGYVVHISKEEDVFTFMDTNGVKLVIDFYDVVEIDFQD
ncbi:hypothetical protein ACFOU2_12930 [Bacillus songklensis]|uniref:YolD-like protein n=1 Tax=Bacillus songklensis TaxID=1069116 RepID=A0ABV8B245_9BACI